jgi:hypothetical protein
MNKTVKVGSRWLSSDMKDFIILAVLDHGDDIWIHYRSNFKEENTEHSCLKESFLSRFSPAPE